MWTTTIRKKVDDNDDNDDNSATENTHRYLTAAGAAAIADSTRTGKITSRDS